MTLESRGLPTSILTFTVLYLCFIAVIYPCPNLIASNEIKGARAKVGWVFLYLPLAEIKLDQIC